MGWLRTYRRSAAFARQSGWGPLCSDQLARLLQIGGVEPLGEGGEQFGESRACLPAFRAAPAEAREPRHGAELQRASCLAGSALDSGMEQCFRSFARVGRRSVGAAGLGQYQLGVDPVDLGFVVALASRHGQGLTTLGGAGPLPG